MTLSRAGFNIPNGFIITIDAFRLYSDTNGLNKDIRLLAKASQKQYALAAKRIQARIRKSSFPEELRQELNHNLILHKFNSYAVRSSATVEDGAKNSWAGQFESYINVSATHLEKAVKNCWASMFTPRVRSYSKNIIGVNAIEMAVVVQESIAADVSGVCFTQNVFSGEKQSLVIEAVFGAGEDLVSGKITPDRYMVERKTNIIIEAEINPQSRKGVSRERAWQQKLSGAEIIELTKLAMKIEKTFGFPCDIEWCKKGSHFYILQSRPITAYRNI